MQLSELFKIPGDLSGIDIRGMELDSRQVEPGFLFAALPGSNLDGRDFVPQALERGAVAILTGPKKIEELGGAVQINVPDPRHDLAKAAAKFYGPQPNCIAAVTGTNGKTSVANFVFQIWTRLGRNAACIGTLGVESSSLKVDRGLTTPDSITLQRTLSNLAAAGTTHVVLEASSHGISQCRLDGAAITIAAFTNLSREHLDYHQTIDEYFAAKARLFEALLPPEGSAVINLDSSHGQQLARAMQAQDQTLLDVGTGAAGIRVCDLLTGAAGTSIRVEYLNGNHEIQLPLVGAFQAMNALLAAGIVIASGEDPAAVFGLLEQLKGVPGRFELAGASANGGRIFIDYAHTPDGLENILTTARAITTGSLAVVFGCGGDRDRGKRPEMGAVAARLADRVYITDDNPRSEDPAAIRAEVIAAAPEARELDDRAQAIAVAIDELGPDDTLIVAGKGHETGQIVGDNILPFNDLEVIRHQLDESLAEVGK